LGVVRRHGRVAAAHVASWYRVVIEAREGGVRVRNLFRDGFIAWDEIDRFSIKAPARRTPLHLAFSPSADVARVRRLDGTSRRIRALKPWHGFTTLVYFDLVLPSDAATSSMR
jgi:Bacterial PH domain